MLVCGAVVVNKYTLCVFGPSRILILRAGNVHFSSEHAALMFSRFLSQKPPEAILAIIIFKIFLGGGMPPDPPTWACLRTLLSSSDSYICPGLNASYKHNVWLRH